MMEIASEPSGETVTKTEARDAWPSKAGLRRNLGWCLSLDLRILVWCQCICASQSRGLRLPGGSAANIS